MKRSLVLAVLLTLVACREQDGLEPVSRTHPRAAQARDDQVNFKFTQASYADAIERAGPGVVTIRAARRQRAAQQPFLADPLSGGLQPDAGRQLALGSGVIVEPDGIILTNHHLTDGSDSIVIELVDRRVFDAKVLGADPPSDLAVLKIDARNLPTLNLGDSDRVRVGDVALAIGNPLGVGQTVTAGIISAKGRSTGFSNGSFEDFLQTDAPINQGNSGGALDQREGRADRHQLANSLKFRRQYRHRLRDSFQHGAQCFAATPDDRKSSAQPFGRGDATDNTRDGGKFGTQRLARSCH